MPADARTRTVERKAKPAATRGEGAWGLGFDRSPVPMWVEEEGTQRILAVNDAAVATYGYSRAEFLTLTLSDLQGYEAIETRLRHRKADGTVIDVKIERTRIVAGRSTVCLAVIIEADDQALRDSEARYRQLFDAAADGFWEADVKGRMTYVSPNYEAMFGMSVADMLGKRIQDFPGVAVPPDMAERALAAMKQREPFRDFIYSRRIPASQKLRWVHTNCVPFFDKAGEFVGYRGVARDISAQIEADLALRESERQARQLFEVAADYYWEMDANYRYAFVSPGYEKISGLAPEQLIGKRLTEAPGVSVEPEMGKMVLVAYKTKQPFRDFVYSRKLADGTTRWFKTSGTPHTDKDGVFRGYRGVGAEITQNIEAEAAARMAQRRLHDAVAYVSQPFVVYDAADRAVAYNQAFNDLHGNPGGKTPVHQGVSFQELVHWQLQMGFYAEGPDDPALDLDLLLGRYQTEGEHAYHLRDGRWMMVLYRRLPGEGRVGLWTDITAIKRTEAERHRLEAQLHHSQRLEALGTLAGGAAHEINNALVPVLALTKLVASRLPEDSRDRRNLGLVMVGAKRSRDLVKQILAFSRKEEQRLESVDVAAVLRDVLQLMRATVPASIRLAEEIAPVPPVVGDPNQLRQVIVNLVNNAAQAIGEAMGTITLGLCPTADGAHLCLSVADTGCGMDAATRARVFEPFFTTKEVGKGTGLGLAVVHGIIKDHGGRIEVTSTPGRGSRFDIFLPVAPAEAVQAA